MNQITKKEFITEFEKQFDNEEEKNMVWNCMQCGKKFNANWNSSDYCTIKCANDKINYVLKYLQKQGKI